MKIAGLQKLTLLDYPNKIACTIFTSGCNFMCPFCHNSSLVKVPENAILIEENQVLDFLKSRIGKLEGVCISGGEPTLQTDLIDFIKKIKEMGFKVKLDTNGFNYEKLKFIIDSNLIDYVAMDIKNSYDKYALTCGLTSMNLGNIKKSISLLKENRIDYEFRTTIVKELHDFNDIKKISEMLQGAKRYYLQQFEDTPYNIKNGYNAHEVETLIKFKDYLNNNNIHTELRGIK